MKRLSLLLIIFVVLMGSCKKDEPPSEVTPEMARDSLYYIMKSYYYWYNLMPVVDKENYSNPYDLLDAMRYLPIDLHWSFVADYDEYLSEMEDGTFVGHGYQSRSE